MYMYIDWAQSCENIKLEFISQHAVSGAQPLTAQSCHLLDYILYEITRYLVIIQQRATFEATTVTNPLWLLYTC